MRGSPVCLWLWMWPPLFFFVSAFHLLDCKHWCTMTKAHTQSLVLMVDSANANRRAAIMHLPFFLHFVVKFCTYLCHQSIYDGGCFMLHTFHWRSMEVARGTLSLIRCINMRHLMTPNVRMCLYRCVKKVQNPYELLMISIMKQLLYHHRHIHITLIVDIVHCIESVYYLSNDKKKTFNRRSFWSNRTELLDWLMFVAWIKSVSR